MSLRFALLKLPRVRRAVQLCALAVVGLSAAGPGGAEPSPLLVAGAGSPNASSVPGALGTEGVAACHVDVRVDSAVVCPGVSAQLCATPLSGRAPFTYLWNTGATTACILASQPGLYTVTVTDARGCTGVGSGLLTEVPSLAVDVRVSGWPVCPGDEAVLCAMVVGGLPPYSFAWNNGAPDSCIAVTVAGTYTVVVTDALGCMVAAQVTLSGPTRMEIAGVTVNDAVVCEGETAQLCASVVGAIPPLAFEWNTGEQSQCITTGSGGLHSVVVYDFCSVYTAAGTVTVNPRPTCHLSAPDPPPVAGSTGNQLCAAADGATGYEWTVTSADTGWKITDGQGTPCITYTAGNRTAATFQVVSVSPAQCRDTCSVETSSAGSTGVGPGTPPPTAGYALSRAAPNPFTQETVVHFVLPERSAVRLAVFSVAGQEVAVLAEGEVGAGVHSARWRAETRDGHAAPPGIYCLRLSATGLESHRAVARTGMVLLVR